MGLVDLHVHTTASDGVYSPSEVVCQAAICGVSFLGITDHDSTEGVAEAERAATLLPVQVVPGVEINADYPRTELHMLGYYVDLMYEPLQDTLQALRAGRLARGRRMVERLTALGLPVSWERVIQLAGEGSAVGRPHVAQAMVEQGYVSSLAEAFARYIGRGKLAHVERFKLGPVEAIALIRAAGGVPVLAHPLQLMDAVPELVQAGLAGLEVYYTGYSAREIALLTEVTVKYGLLVTGGSDFHGEKVLPGCKLGGTHVPLDVMPPLLASAANREN